MASKLALAPAPAGPVAPHVVVARRPGHLRTRADFLRVQRGGRRYRGHFLTLLVAPTPTDAPTFEARLGLTVSRKVGNAVVRNRVRRVLREAWRAQLHGAQAGFDHVVVAYPQAAHVGLHAAQQELACLMAKARDPGRRGARWAPAPGQATPSSASTA